MLLFNHKRGKYSSQNRRTHALCRGFFAVYHKALPGNKNYGLVLIMPRRDGLPTNEEMLADFNAASHQVFIHACQMDLQYPLPPAYEDKRLTDIRLNVMRAGGRLTTQAVMAETLTVTALTPHVASYLGEHLRYRDYPQDVLDHYTLVATKLTDTHIRPGLDIRKVLPPEGIHAGYEAVLPDGHSRHISTFKEKPAKQSIAAGTFMAREVLDHLTAGYGVQGSTLELLAAVIQPGSGPVFARRFSLIISPDLPLNGHEPREFLLNFYEEMSRCAGRRLDLIERLSEVGAPQILIDNERSTYDRYSKAVAKAQKALDKSQ
jgi:hypothetical protein